MPGCHGENSPAAAAVRDSAMPRTADQDRWPSSHLLLWEGKRIEAYPMFWNGFCVTRSRAMMGTEILDAFAQRDQKGAQQVVAA